MEDSRVIWIKERVYAALGLREDELFEDLLQRDGKHVEKELATFLDSRSEQYSPAVLFYPLEREVEEEVEVVEEELIEQLVEQAERLEEGQPDSNGSAAADGSISGGEAGSDAASVGGSSDHGGSQEGDSGTANGEPKKVTKKTLVKNKVRKRQLFMCYKHLPEAVSTVGFFFSRTTSDPIPVPSSSEEANSLLPKCFETGSINSKPLNALERVLTHVYIPMLMAAGQRSGDGGGLPSVPPPNGEEAEEDHPPSRSESHLKSLMRDELLISVQKFATQVQRTIQHVEGEVKLEIPDVILPEDRTQAARDSSLIAQLEPAMEKWATVISTTVDEQLKKQPQGKGPLAEIDFWKERNSALSAIYEQLKLPVVQEILVVLKAANSPSYSNFEYHRSELNKYYLEAKDNVKFLSTLERHFKNIAHGANFTIVLDTIPAMMNALRMVWVISRHYNTDERMVPLMVRIAWELCERAARVVNVRTIFKYSLPEIKHKASEARRLLETWKQSYLDVRKKIEQSGRDARWEFDRKKLFERSDYIAQICSDIYDVVQTIEEFHNIFGPELKAVTGDPERIEEVLQRVNSLVLDIEIVRFDPYNPSYRHDWKSVMSRFQREVKLIEEEANTFIDESFQKLRSAEGAFDMLHNFKHIRARDAINATMMKKFNEILITFEKEVDAINELFIKHKDKPPVSKNQPQVAGAISWSRSLFQRIKNTVLRFQTMKDLIDSEAGKAASKRYLAVARSMKQFEDDLYTEWLDNVDTTLPNLLKRTVLTKPPPPTFASLTATPLPGESRSSSRAGHRLPPLLPPNCEYVVNFSPELVEIISEAKYLEKLGFQVPELARSVALQEEKFLAFVDGLNRCLHRYHHALASLTEAETELLHDQIKTLQRVLKPGSKRLNWNSLGTQDYITKCEQAITKFESVANQVQNNAGDIDERLHMIEAVRLFKQPPPKTGCELPEAKEYFEFQDSHRNHIFSTLSRKYHAIGPLLIKVEGLVVFTNTGKSPRLKQYYAHWEKKIFDSLVKMVTNNLLYYSALLKSGQPLFTVEALLSPPEIVLHPHASELFKLMVQAMREIVEGTKRFPRWLNGSCIEADPLQVPGQDEPVTFSFFSDVSMHPAVNEAALCVQEMCKSAIASLVKHANTWKKYRLLWKMQRDILLEKFAQRNPSCVAYDEKLNFYSSVAAEISTQSMSRQVEFALLHMEPLSRALQENARCWVTSLGKLLSDYARESLMQLKEELEGLSDDLKRSPDTLEDLKFVLSVIAKIRVMSLDVELQYRDVQERYRTLAMYDISVPQEELEVAAGIEQQWMDLAVEARHVDKSLITVKKKFTLITQDQVKTFLQDAEKFNQKFKEEGPACVGTDLDKGVKVLKEHQSEYAKFEQQRQELTNAEKLFDLPITMFPDLTEVDRDLKNMAKVYELYEAQRVAREEWSGTLWANLNIEQLTEGIEEFMKKLRKFPKEVKALPICHVLEGRMREFKDSIPLFSDLKNDALRDRHWEKLMKATGKNFDVNSDTFTLENLFAMELHNYVDTISEIVGSANKELNIEKSLEEVVTTWQNLCFTVYKQERGHLLGAVDEIVLALDDNAMNLQSMAASRFVGPFFEKVQKWEKSLSHISEVVDVSY